MMSHRKPYCINEYKESIFVINEHVVLDSALVCHHVYPLHNDKIKYITVPSQQKFLTCILTNIRCAEKHGYGNILRMLLSTLYTTEMWIGNERVVFITSTANHKEMEMLLKLFTTTHGDDARNKTNLCGWMV